MVLPPSTRRVGPDGSLVCRDAGTHLQQLTAAFGVSTENVALVAPANASAVIPGVVVVVAGVVVVGELLSPMVLVACRW